MRSRQQKPLSEAAQLNFSSTGITSARLRGTRRRLRGVFAEIRIYHSSFLILNYHKPQLSIQIPHRLNIIKTMLMEQRGQFFVEIVVGFHV